MTKVLTEWIPDARRPSAMQFFVAVKSSVVLVLLCVCQCVFALNSSSVTHEGDDMTAEIPRSESVTNASDIVQQVNGHHFVIGNYNC